MFMSPSVTPRARSDAVLRLVFIFQLPPTKGLRSGMGVGYPTYDCRVHREYQVIVIGGGHAGVEAAWAAANLLGGERSVALVTLDPSKIGVMSCNLAIGGLAKGQL